MLTIPLGNCAHKATSSKYLEGQGSSEEQHVLQILGRASHPCMLSCLFLSASSIRTNAPAWVATTNLFISF